MIDTNKTLELKPLSEVDFNSLSYGEKLPYAEQWFYTEMPQFGFIEPKDISQDYEKRSGKKIFRQVSFTSIGIVLFGLMDIYANGFSMRAILYLGVVAMLVFLFLNKDKVIEKYNMKNAEKIKKYKEKYSEDTDSYEIELKNHQEKVRKYNETLISDNEMINFVNSKINQYENEILTKVGGINESEVIMFDFLLKGQVDATMTKRENKCFHDRYISQFIYLTSTSILSVVVRFNLFDNSYEYSDEKRIFIKDILSIKKDYDNNYKHEFYKIIGNDKEILVPELELNTTRAFKLSEIIWASLPEIPSKKSPYYKVAKQNYNEMVKFRADFEKKWKNCIVGLAELSFLNNLDGIASLSYYEVDITQANDKELIDRADFIINYPIYKKWGETKIVI